MISRVGLWLAVALWVAAAHGAQAHPMGNFSISHYARFQPDGRTLAVHYILDIAEIPTVTEKDALDADHDGVISPQEKAAYLAAQARRLGANVTLAVNGRPVPLRLVGDDLRLSPGAAGLETLKIFLDWQAPLPPAQARPAVAWADRNFPDRTGWKQVVAVSGSGDAVQASSASADDPSQGLSVYPRDVIPPQDTQAHFAIAPGGLAVAAASAPPAAPARDATPRDAFTQVIARRALTPGVMLAGLLIAFVFGAFHALSPGHGKTMVAAYLVGTRGTPKHAVALGVIVTITHTFGVFLLGFVTLFAARYVVPEKLYPVLGVVSGLSVFGVGLWLLWSRLRGLPDGHAHDHDHTHEEHTHDHVHDHVHAHGPDEIHLHTHDDGHVHDHTHSHDHDHSHTHDHAHDHGHSHGFGHHHHHGVPEGPITAKTLIALGVSGGIVPCPSALVVLLSAIALHRVAYGLLLISAFSVGLASVLVGIGLLVVSARRLADRFPSSGPLLQRLPLASAAAITLIGLMLVIRAFTPGGF